ncbi:MAG: ATP-dependent DNA helicase RecG [Clostridia bacterium]|nr:ATP-dependent DNA helicase RecG [Clostridia bacterium]
MRALSEIRGFGEKRLKSLEDHGIRTAEDLIGFLPSRYYDAMNPMEPSEMQDGVTGCFRAYILGLPSFHYGKSGKSYVSVIIGDERKKLRCMFFNQPWIREKLVKNQERIFYGQAVQKSNGIYVINPLMIEPGIITPVYRKLPDIGQKTLRDAIRLLLDELDEQDWMPEEIRDRYQLMSEKEAYTAIHFPKESAELERAKARMAFDDLLLFQTAISGHMAKKQAVHPLLKDAGMLDTFYAGLSYTPTGAQARAVTEIAEDLMSGYAMARMVQGDVGCGKTMIAFAAMYLCARAGAQAAMMAPTEILAAQHYENAVRELGKYGITCGLLTGKMTAAEHRRAIEAIKNGEWQVIIGTHALISQGVEYHNLRLVITDEQHRFGVRQRTVLGEKGDRPHVLVMSATPIPRTLSLILYGDIDISIVDELPPGRIPVRTRLVPEEKRMDLYRFIRQEVKAGRQCYVVCPLIGDAEEADEKSAVSVCEQMRDALPDVRISLLHGQMKKEEKEAVLDSFYAGKVDILVSTTVIEVGVNVPNASVMVIEGANRFGLAQLHQLRGRVGRGTESSWCFLMAEANERLRFLCSTNDGFEIARKDLELRGAGEYFGTRQSGAPELPGVALSGDGQLLAKAREAFLYLSENPALAEDYQAVMRKAEQRYGQQIISRN